MRILVVGSGGREHAIVKKISQSEHVMQIFCAPGNGGTENLGTNVNIKADDILELVKFAQKEKIDLTIVGPEISLEKGIVDEFQKNNLKIFGPTKLAAEIETSKCYAKEIMQKYEIPSAKYQVFNNAEVAYKYLEDQNFPIVIKYDGLASGKGVVICENEIEAKAQIKIMLEDKKYGNSAVIIEEFLEGEEFTLLSLVNGAHVYPLEISRDYKKAYDNDQGLNTGGMGAICPYDKISLEEKKAATDILTQCAKALKNEGRTFQGVLYGGFIATKNGVKVIEFNARFGDPETEVVLQKLENDLVELIVDILEDKEVKIINNDKFYHGVVLASQGYPTECLKNYEIKNIEGLNIDHMGTQKIGEKYQAIGGRVLLVSNSGNTPEEAKEKTYQQLAEKNFENMFYRKDIGN